MSEQIQTAGTLERTESTTQNLQRPPKSTRLLSLDALRGFDMLWILGGEFFVESLDKAQGHGFLAPLARQLEHKEWQGFAFYDMIFPLFVFMVGISIVFSIGKIIREEGKAAAHKRIFKRFILLFIFALLYSGGVSADWPNFRLLGVPNRIALCDLGAALLYTHFKMRGLVAPCAGLL